MFKRRFYNAVLLINRSDIARLPRCETVIRNKYGIQKSLNLMPQRGVAMFVQKWLFMTTNIGYYPILEHHLLLRMILVSLGCYLAITFRFLFKTLTLYRAKFRLCLANFGSAIDIK